ncbi:MAG: pentapeptide repeat-containing protein [Bacteroidetes bacterium]|nr:pentapeptide repeat-containing protein [Bacteroidota bacterium]
MKKGLTKEWKNLVEYPNGVTLNFTEIPGVMFNAKNVSNCSITGNMSRKHRLNHTNLISSRIENLNAKSVSFYNVDLKDCHINRSTFQNCNLNHASHNNNLLSNSHFSKCTFNQTAITLSDFRDCTFQECDFTNVIISDCRFFNCSFAKCTTSNKMIESSILLDCSFSYSRLEYETITGNFGIEASRCDNCTFVFRQRGDKKINLTEFTSELSKFQNTSNRIEEFRLAYFLKPSIISEPSDEVESLFVVNDWIGLSKNPNRFRLHIERLHEFLLYQFDQDKVRLRTLAQLFEVSAKLSDAFASKPEFIDLQRTSDGVFLSLERILEKYLDAAEDLLLDYEEAGYCRILVEGPLEKEYYYEKLRPLLDIAPVTFGKIVKHNSPNELYLHWEKIKDAWPYILFIFTTKFKVELNKLDVQTRKIRSKENNILRDNQMFKIENTGLNKSEALSFRLKTLLPGHHELSLVVQFSLPRYKQLMKTLKGWINFEPKS